MKKTKEELELERKKSTMERKMTKGSAPKLLSSRRDNYKTQNRGN